VYPFLALPITLHYAAASPSPPAAYSLVNIMSHNP